MRRFILTCSNARVGVNTKSRIQTDQESLGSSHTKNYTITDLHLHLNTHAQYFLPSHAMHTVFSVFLLTPVLILVSCTFCYSFPRRSPRCLRKALNHWIPGNTVSCQLGSCCLWTSCPIFSSWLISSFAIPFLFFLFFSSFQWFHGQAATEGPWRLQRLRKTRRLRGGEFCWLSWQLWCCWAYWSPQDTSVSHCALTVNFLLQCHTHAPQDILYHVSIQDKHVIQKGGTFMEGIFQAICRSNPHCSLPVQCATPFPPQSRS